MNFQDLQKIAQAHGVATSYWEYNGTIREVSEDTLLKVLKSLGIFLDTVEEQNHALRMVDYGSWAKVIEPTVVADFGKETDLPVYVPHMSPVEVSVILENGMRWPIAQKDIWVEPRYVEDVITGQATFSIPADLPLGYHQVEVKISDWMPVTSHIIVVPQKIDNKVISARRAWGLQAQIYSIRSNNSWGLGDVRDLRDLLVLGAQQGADFVLINPLHAAEPCAPITDSPYLPSTRKFINPIYIRPEDIEEYAYLALEKIQEIQALKDSAKSKNYGCEPIDRNSIWEQKSKTIRIIYESGRSVSRQAQYQRFIKEQGSELADFALWCAVTEKYGDTMHKTYVNIHTPQVQEIRSQITKEIDFYMWLQWIIDQQLQIAQSQAKESGMAFGICADLAVGVHPLGADTWTHPQNFAAGVTVGAPPDMYNQIGQDWSQPPWSPTALRNSGYMPLRSMLRTVLHNAGAIRMDHVMGLFRLWWIPAGNNPSEGTYVYYDHRAMVGIIMLEAMKSEAVVIGEDLGNVEPWVRDYISERGVIGTSVIWFEQDNGYPLPPERYRFKSIATVNTHDLPPTRGYLEIEHVNLRERLGLLVEDAEEVRLQAQEEINRYISKIRAENIITAEELNAEVSSSNISDMNKSFPEEREDLDIWEIVLGIHRYICKTPAALVGVSLTDAVEEFRAQNQPGTYREYDNWRIPLCNKNLDPVIVDDLGNNSNFIELTSLVNKIIKNTDTNTSTQ